MRAILLFTVVMTFSGTAIAVSFPMVCPVPCDYCSEYEVLHTTPPCCEATCDLDCSRVVCPKMLIYQPTCVCLDGFVRHKGKCIPKTNCPMPETVTTATVPCEETTPAATVPCETTTTEAPCTTTATPETTTSCPTTTVSYTTKLRPMYTPKPCGYSPPPLKCSSASHVPAPPTPSYETIPPYRYRSNTLPTKPCPTTPAPCTTTPKPCTTTPPPPCETTTPCPTTTTLCPTTPAVPCSACEQLVFTQSCCEPSCDFDCSGSSCPFILVEQPTCACRPGLVRYQGHCIEPSACPRSVSRYRLYVPVAAQCLHCDSELATGS